jgi:hypothetical protein
MDNKQKIYGLLEDKQFERLLDLFDQDPNLVRKYMTMAAFYMEKTLGKNALEFIGFLSEKRAAQKPEYFREIIRRHIWGMNEEGANIDWMAPEIIGTIIASEPGLYGEFTSIMITAAIDEPIFQKGMFKAIRMLGPKNKELFEYHLPRLKEFVEDEDVELAELAQTVLREIEEIS